MRDLGMAVLVVLILIAVFALAVVILSSIAAAVGVRTPWDR